MQTYRIVFPVPYHGKHRVSAIHVKSNGSPKKTELLIKMNELIRNCKDRLGTERETIDDARDVNDYEKAVYSLKNLVDVDDIPDIIKLNVSQLPITCRTEIGESIIQIYKISEHVLSSIPERAKNLQHCY